MSKKIVTRTCALLVGVAAVPILAAQAQTTAEERRQLTELCRRYAGEIVRTSEGNMYCNTPALDRECARSNRDEGYSFNVYTGSCYESPCFFTTACVEMLGLRDDCFELRTLRRFRDERLAAMPGGAQDIALYYALAPRILDAIRAGGRARVELARIYASMVVPSALSAAAGRDGLARTLYRRGMLRLIARHGITAAA